MSAEYRFFLFFLHVPDFFQIRNVVEKHCVISNLLIR